MITCGCHNVIKFIILKEIQMINSVKNFIKKLGISLVATVIAFGNLGFSSQVEAVLPPLFLVCNVEGKDYHIKRIGESNNYGLEVKDGKRFGTYYPLEGSIHLSDAALELPEHIMSSYIRHVCYIMPSKLRLDLKIPEKVFIFFNYYMESKHIDYLKEIEKYTKDVISKGVQLKIKPDFNPPPSTPSSSGSSSSCSSSDSSSLPSCSPPSLPAPLATLAPPSTSLPVLPPPFVIKPKVQAPSPSTSLTFGPPPPALATPPSPSTSYPSTPLPAPSVPKTPVVVPGLVPVNVSFYPPSSQS